MVLYSTTDAGGATYLHVLANHVRVHVHRGKIINDDCTLDSILVVEDSLKQSRLARAQKPGQQRERKRRVRVSHHRV